MKLYPFGTFPTDPPAWFAETLAKSGMNAAAIPIWHLTKAEVMSAPGAFLLRMPPGYTLFRHGHPCERFEVIIQGTLEVGDGQTAKAGDIFTADAYTLYGPHVAGPEGCTTVEVFSSLDGIFRLLYEGANGEIKEANALKGELPPEYVPLPDDAAAAR